MLSREEHKKLNTEFWNDFRVYMNKFKSSNGRRINWITYPSDVKDIYIRLQSDAKGARLCMDIQPKDQGVREILWEQMNELKKVLESSMNHETIWVESMFNAAGLEFSRIYWEDSSLNFYNKEDKQAIFQFLKDRLIEFDEFYQEFKEILILLTD